MRMALSASRIYGIILVKYGYVAQLDRASDSGSEGRGFESLHTRDESKVYLALQGKLC